MDKIKYKFVIFDVDGTLLDTRDGIIASVQYAIKKENLRCLSEKELLTFIGPPIMESFACYYDDKDGLIDRLTKLFRDRYASVDLLKAEVYPMLENTCKDLYNAGIKLGVATYKRQDYAERIVKGFPIGQYFQAIYGADSNNKLKKSDIILLAKKALGANADDKVLMIGDTLFDAKGAKELDMDFLGVTYGFGFKTKEEVLEAGAIGSVDNASEIAKYIL